MHEATIQITNCNRRERTGNMTDVDTASELHTGSGESKRTYLREYDQWVLFSQLSHMGFPIRLVATEIHSEIDRRNRVN
jgi:hypothetical protein